MYETLSQPGLASAKPGFVERLIHADSIHTGCHWVTFEKAAVYAGCGGFESNVVRGASTVV